VGDNITPEYLNTYVKGVGDAFNSAWTTYTPTITGYTTATTTVYGAYVQVGKLVLFRAGFKLATVTTLGTSAITMSLPVTAAYVFGGGFNIVGEGWWRTNAGVFVPAYAYATTSSATSVSIRMATPTSTNPALLGMTGAFPTGQVVGDSLQVTGWYEAA
jgi:hypothetical protein